MKLERPWNVLVFPGGTEIGLEVANALRDCKEINLISAGSDVSNHAPYVFRRHHILPDISNEVWLDELNRLLEDHAIDFIVPAYDDIIVALMNAGERIAGKVVSSPLETCLIARSKKKTYDALRDVVPCPEVYGIANVQAFPVFCKPDRGQGSQRARAVSKAEELALVRSDEVLLEYLPGEEFTVDCFSDRRRGLMFAQGRRRVRVRNGISVATCADGRPEFREYAEAIGAKLEFHGAWFYQVKEASDGTLKLLEIAPRIAGAMAFHRVQGINFPLLSIYEKAGYPIELLTNDGCEIRLDRALINRYEHNLTFGTVYVDLDDTLIVRGAVHLGLIAFLYQCVNSGVKIVLLTKHAGDLTEHLRQHRLSGLFDEIRHLSRGEDKVTAIDCADAIFIDDSFAERRAVQFRKGIPTFDLSMIEMLMDSRTPHAEHAAPATS